MNDSQSMPVAPAAAKSDAIPESIVVELGTIKITVPALPLGKIEQLEDTLIKPDGPNARSYDRILAVICAAISGSHPQLTPDAIRQLYLKPRQVMAAYRQILVHSGLNREQQPGEASAGTA